MLLLLLLLLLCRRLVRVWVVDICVGSRVVFWLLGCAILTGGIWVIVSIHTTISSLTAIVGH